MTEFLFGLGESLALSDGSCEVGTQFGTAGQFVERRIEHGTRIAERLQQMDGAFDPDTRNHRQCDGFENRFIRHVRYFMIQKHFLLKPAHSANHRGKHVHRLRKNGRSNYAVSSPERSAAKGTPFERHYRANNSPLR